MCRFFTAGLVGIPYWASDLFCATSYVTNYDPELLATGVGVNVSDN